MRDDFPQKIKNALALRAAYLCSFPGCQRPTVGPSDEAPDAHACVGEAAHITAAAPGAGARRYDPSLTKTERASIDNAIWLCATHARLIDRDEVTYTVEEIRRWKSAHERERNAAITGGWSPTSGVPEPLECNLIGLGPRVVALGVLLGTQGSRWRMQIFHFVAGGVADLIGLGEEFESLPESDRYILLNALGDGRGLATTPTWSRANGHIAVEADVLPKFPRTHAQNLGADLKLEDGDLSPDFVLISGVDRLPQHLELTLGLGRGEPLLPANFGSRIAEYFALYGGTPWFERLVKLEMVRLAAIPYRDETTRTLTTPLDCIERVIAVTAAPEFSADRRLPIRVALDVAGLGHWERDLKVYVGAYPAVIPNPPSASLLDP